MLLRKYNGKAKFFIRNNFGVRKRNQKQGYRSRSVQYHENWRTKAFTSRMFPPNKHHQPTIIKPNLTNLVEFNKKIS